MAVFSYEHPSSSPCAEVIGSKVSKRSLVMLNLVLRLHAQMQVFFLKAFYQSGTLQLDGKELVDHVWVTKEEMRDYVSQEYYQAVEPILTL